MPPSQPAAAAAPPKAPSAKPSLHLGQLDALRGIAILGVVLVHGAFAAGIVIQSPLGQLAFLGERGVQLFYMISAFTLFYTLDNSRPEEHPTSNFYLRRFFRIAPLFYCCIVFNLLVNGMGFLRWYHYLSGFLFLNGLSHSAINWVTPGSWSIAVETNFYLFVPLLFARIKTLSRALLVFCLGTALFVPISFWLSLRGGVYFSFFYFPVQFPVFMLGIVAYMVWKTTRAHAPDSAALSLPTRRALSAGLLIASLIVLTGSANLHPAPARITWPNTHMVPSAVAFLLLILSLMLHQWPALVNAFTRFLGKISYSVYLAHPFILQALFWLGRRYLRPHLSPSLLAQLHGSAIGGLIVATCLLAACIPICALLWKFIEQPGIRLGRRIIAAREHRAAQRNQALVPHLDELTNARNTPDAQF